MSRSSSKGTSTYMAKMAKKKPKGAKWSFQKILTLY